MERTKPGKGIEIQTLQDRLTVLSQLVGRAQLAAKLGQQYGTDRNIYEALGYKTNITYADYASRYLRQDIARAIIDRPVKVTWQGDLEIIESDDDKETPLQKDWVELRDRLKLKSQFSRLDKLTGIGEFGVLLLGFSDVKKRDDFALPVSVGREKKLLYVKPFSQGDVEITKWETQAKNPRYGLPTEYTITITNPAGGEAEVRIHHTRVLHITDEKLESDVKGLPRLEAVYNRLMDLEKLVGGDAEMFWRGARPGYQGKLDKDFTMTTDTEDDLKDQIDEYENNLRRILIMEGVDLQSLAQQISDPSAHVDVQLQMISAVTGIPKRILTGSERGELSSSQDRTEWLSFVKSRREEFAEPNIVRPFVDKCIEYKILPEPKEKYDVQWQDLFAQSEKEKVDIGKSRSEALSKYASSPMAEMTIPPDEFLRYFLGLEKEQIDQIVEAREVSIREEEKRVLTPEEEELERQRLEKEKIEE